MDQDHELIQRTLKGDLFAFDELVKKYQRPIYLLCLSFINHHEDARDVAQEVFLKAFRGLKSFRHQASFWTWIYRLTVNTCLSFNKRKRREFFELRAIPSKTTYAFVDAIEKADNLRRIQSLSEQLPKKQRAAFILRLEHGLSYEEISEITGQTVTTVKTTVFYALRRIKGLLKKPRGPALRYFKHLESD